MATDILPITGLQAPGEVTVPRPGSAAPDYAFYRAATATDIDRWLADKAKRLSTRTLRLLHSLLNRAVTRAMARDKVKRNVVALCAIPHGQQGRPSKSLTLEQAKALLAAAEDSPLHAYVVLSLLTGARTEELRALTWAHVDLDRGPADNPPIPPSVHVWRSVRVGGDTKTRKSRRTLALPARCVTALAAHYERQGRPAGDQLVFATSAGTALDRHNVLRAFRPVIRKAGLDPHAWTPRELRHSFSRSCRATVSASKTSPTSAATPAPPSPRASTGTNFGRCS